MPLEHLAILALVQGITEFLPISSSGHLVLVPVIAGWQDQGLLLDVAVHVGTLFAVMLYLWRDIWAMFTGLGRFLKGRSDPGANLAILIVLATLPVIAVGYFVNKHFPGGIRSVEVIGWATLGFGIFLGFADKVGMTLKRIEHIRFFDAMAIGVFQVLALIPGTSRSGITMAAARLLGFERPDAARFSMLLSIPTIIGAGTLKGLELYETGNPVLTHEAFLGVAMSFAAALVAIALLMSWLKRASFMPFVVYRIVLGAALLAFTYGYVG